MRARTAVAVAVALLVWAVCGVANASFDKQVSATLSAGSTMLHPPTNVSVKVTACNATITWTQTVDTRADGYYVGINGGGQMIAVTPKSANKYVFAMTRRSSYTFIMATYYLNWYSAVTSATAAVSC